MKKATHTKTKEEILNAINEFKVDIWSNPKRPDSNAIQNGCEYCGKKHGSNPLYVHINTNGIILPNSITEDDLNEVGMESQGCWALGSGCAKKLFGDKIDLYTIKDLH